MSVSLASSHAPSQPRTLLSPASSYSHVVKENSGLCWDKDIGVQGKPLAAAGSTELKDRSVPNRHDLCPRIVGARREAKQDR